MSNQPKNLEGTFKVKYQHVLIKPFTISCYDNIEWSVGTVIDTTAEPVYKTNYKAKVTPNLTETIPREYIGIKKITTIIMEEMVQLE